MPSVHPHSIAVHEEISASHSWGRAATEDSAARVPSEPSEKARPEILLVDGDYDTRVVFGTYLDHVGFGVRAAPTPGNALRLARLSVPDAIVCELLLPRVNGRHFVEWLRADPVARRIPIVGVTACAFPLSESYAAAGCSRVLRKPCPLTHLLDTLRSVGVEPNQRAVQLRIVNGWDNRYP